jgi:hypothetical protein
MSATLPSRHDPSRHNWWNRSSKSSSKSTPRLPLDRPQTADSPSRNHLTFHAFASVIGLKSKKIPLREPSSLNILRPIDNWDVLRKSSGALSQRPTNAKSSTTATLSRLDTAPSRAPIHDDKEPRTRRNSLLTLADDPFAPRPPLQPPLPSTGNDRLDVASVPQNQTRHLSNPGLARTPDLLDQQRPSVLCVSL